ncbi:MAG: hypothetical protein NTW48_07355 [Chloroflexi bacterium]|nr:hypothetical protein [Chloroflexota bacterium]
MAVRAAGTAVVVVDTVAGTAVVVVDTVADIVVVVAALANLAAFHSCCRTLLQKQPERHTWGIDTTAASQPHACYIPA